MRKLLLGLVSLLAFTACNHNDFEPMSTQEIVTNNYNAVFVKTFGKPDANQDWGFGSRVLPTSFGTVTRAAQTNSNQWGTNEWDGRYKNYPKPSAITADELEAVLEVFNTVGAESYTPLIDWSDFYVQQVYKGEAKYTDAAGNEFIGSDEMNELHCATDFILTNPTCWPEVWEHSGTYTTDCVNNFNGGDYKGEDISTWNATKCMLMFHSSTSDWSYKTSKAGGQRLHFFRMEKINGNYYVGLDFAAFRQASANANEDVARDFIYNDWIVKIVPGEGVTPPTPPTRYTVRIICEDLNANGGSDFDFNDVVFDAAYVEGENKTYVTIQCAGGTLPLFVAGNEVHQLFAAANPALNIDVTTMINTNASNGISGLDAVQFVIDEIVAPWDITIAVMRGGNLIPLMANVGSPAAKIAVDPDFEWVDERVDIRTVYPNFSDYVQNTNVNWY
jgi:hypothetical protein